MNEESELPPIKWDLSDFYESVSAPKLVEDLDKIEKLSKELQQNYKGKLKNFDGTPFELKEIIMEYERFFVEFIHPVRYARLSFDTNMTDEKTKEMNNKAQQVYTRVNQQLKFYELELGFLLNSRPELLQSAELSEYEHFLEKLAKKASHNLSEVEEDLILAKDEDGITAWSDFRSMWLNTRMVEVEIEGKPQTLSYGEAGKYRNHPDRATRLSIFKARYGIVGQDKELFAFALRSIFNNSVKMTKRRKIGTPLHDSLIDNDVEEPVIRNMMKTVENNVDLFREYVKIKAKLMNLPKLGFEDRTAPLPNIPDKKYSWDDAKAIALEVYGNFNPRFREITSEMFQRNHIDATPRHGKATGAYCSRDFKAKSSFILMNYDERLNQVFTLAHELGHAIHSYLLIDCKTEFNTQYSMCVAETASTFGELLLANRLVEQAQSKDEKISLFVRMLDNASLTIFAVSLNFYFEETLYDALANGEYLSADFIADTWKKSTEKIYGDSMKYTPHMEWEWGMWPHNFIPDLRYYNYPYVYGNLFVFALYNQYRKNPVDFIPKFKEMLRAGSSVSCVETGKIMGLDTSSMDFWQEGIDVFKDYLQQLKDLL